MADEQTKGTQTVTAEELMKELNIDVTDSNTATFEALIEQAKGLVMTGVDSELEEADFLKSPNYNGAVRAVATQLFYDRTLEAGLSKGVLMFLNKVKGDVLKNVQQS